MNSLNSFFEGFYFGLGFICAALILGTIGILCYLSLEYMRKLSKWKDKLNKEMFEDYLQTVTTDEKYREAKKITEYLNKFNAQRSLFWFFLKYKIKKNKNITQGLKGKYYIAKKK